MTEEEKFDFGQNFLNNLEFIETNLWLSEDPPPKDFKNQQKQKFLSLFPILFLVRSGTSIIGNSRTH